MELGVLLNKRAVGWGSLADRDARVAVTDQDDVVQIPALDLGDDVSHVGLLPGRHSPLVGQPGERHRVGIVAEMGHHVRPRPRPETGPGDQHEICHRCTVTA